MNNNIFSILDKLGFGSQTRAIHAQFSNPILNDQIFVQRIEGQSGINEHGQYDLLCLSTNANIELKQFMGCQVAVDAVTDVGKLNRVTGVVMNVVQGCSDGALTVYRVQLKSGFSLLEKRRNSRVFMNKTAVEIVQIIFKEHQQRSPLFSASLSLDLSGLKQDYDVRPFTMQHNQTDLEMVESLLKRSGINFLIDESEHFVNQNSALIQPQKLRLIDNNHQFSALPRRNIRFHRSDATERFDTITQFMAERTLQPTSVHVQRWQPDALEQEDGAGSVLSFHQHSERYDNDSLALEDAWHISPAWMQDLKGEDGATPSGNSQLEKLNTHLSKQHSLNAKYFKAHSTVRDAIVGYWFTFEGHAEIDEHSGSDREFLILNKQFYNQNNLPKDVQKQVKNLLNQSRWQDHDNEQRQGNTLTLVRRAIPVVPKHNPEQDKPVVHVQRAKVVGLEGESIHVDEWGRIKVRFLFTREEDNKHDGGAGSNNTDTDSAWVDVLTPWASEGFGARFLPRAQDIVIIDFLNGDPDRPFVTGRLHEAMRTPTQFDQKGKLPDTKKLSGIRSQEVDGKGFNQLRFDDTAGQISAQIQSSHEATQLNLGHLSHPKETDTSEGRGEGFELRTDALGAIRAGKGLLVSTYAQNLAKENHLDAKETKTQLEGSLVNSQALSDLAKGQQTDPLDVLENLKDFLNQIEQEDENKAKVFKDAVILLTAPKTVAVTSQEDIYLSADGQISQSAGDSISVSTQKNLIGHAQEKLSLFSAQQGMNLYAGKGPIHIQAQDGDFEALAKQGIHIGSVEDSIRLTASKDIILEVNGSSVQLSSSGINIRTKGLLDVRAGQSSFKNGSDSKPKLTLPPAPKRAQGLLELTHNYRHGEVVKNAGYTVIDNLGKQIQGKLDEQGQAQITGLATGTVKVLFEPDTRDPWSEASDFKREITWPLKNILDPERTRALPDLFNKITEPKTLNKIVEATQKVKAEGVRGLMPEVENMVLSKTNNLIGNVADGASTFVQKQLATVTKDVNPFQKQFGA